ncbi:PA2779 family protein [Desulfocurvibacter africanus]|uniref:PA2779 family protein n=2 Tax=Desulfocurvibacter africanus TaxID=873 RepID=F3Z0H4_DESAF|nr:PA2779 family protein [Desulfocurvibacter africanus]EGJ50984.1 hypothetical protein Desaf_2667 [Desulfocurvibacter africanus subsp. africanus str. Walvis Bay]EMG38544.1 hypothetical protein PCS_00172 [Desulfocurvibacter africanus PCS]
MLAILTSDWFRRIAMLLVLTMTTLSLVPKVEAGFVPTDRSFGPSQEMQELRAKDMATVKQALENKLVTERLSALGYSAEEIDARLAQLSDAEMHQLASEIDTLTVGGDGLGVVIALLIIVILVIVILKLTDTRITVG